MTKKDSSDSSLQTSESTMLPLPDGVAQLLLRWMRCPKCGSSNSIEYRAYEEYQSSEATDIQKEVHQIRCTDCGHGDEGNVRHE